MLVVPADISDLAVGRRANRVSPLQSSVADSGVVAIEAMFDLMKALHWVVRPTVHPEGGPWYL